MSVSLAIQPADPRDTSDRRSLPVPVLADTSSRRRADEIQFWVVYVLTFPVFVLASLVARLVPGRSGAPGESLSVIQEANASAQTCGSFSLMG